MLKKYCEYCGEHQDSGSSHTARSRAFKHEDEQEIDSFLKHFASMIEEEDEEEEEFNLEKTSSYRLEKIASITRRIDSVAEVLEKSGEKKLAYELDKVSDMLDTYRQEKGV